MASPQWSNLPFDILSLIAKVLNSDVDLLHLRSVCSSWRSTLPTRMKPYSFPMKLPPLFSNPSSSDNLRSGGHCILKYSTLYRLSPPDYAPGDICYGWLFRVLEVKPNTFSLLTPLLPEKIQCRSGMIPKHLSLLDYQIFELAKCYQLSRVSELDDVLIRKVIVLWDFVADCDFVVLVLASDNVFRRNDYLRYWKFGDKDWTSIDIKDHEFDDVILFNGKCYAIGWKGEIVSFDAEFNPVIEHSSNEYLLFNHNNFVVHNSDLYVVSKISNREPDEYSSEFEGRYSSGDEYQSPPERKRKLCFGSDEDEDEDDSPCCCGSGDYDYEDEDEDDGEDQCTDEEHSTEDEDYDSDENEETVEVPLRMKILRISDDEWQYYKELEHNEIFLSSDDVSVGVSTKDFGGCKGNCVYLAHKRFSYTDGGIDYGDHHGVFDFDKCRTRTLVLDRACDRTKIYWPPPNWLYESSACSS